MADRIPQRTHQAGPAPRRLATIEQGGWRIEYQEFRADGLPVRLKLAYPGIDLRLAIHEWKSLR